MYTVVSVSALFAITYSLLDSPARALDRKSGELSSVDDYTHLYINPRAKSQPHNKWITVIWSLRPSDVQSSDPDTPAAVDSETPLTVLRKGGYLSTSLDTRKAVTTQGRLVTIVYKQIFEPPLKLWNAQSNGFRFEVPISVSSYEQKGRGITYIDATFIISNVKTRESIWLDIRLFDPRGDERIRVAGNWHELKIDSATCSPSKSTKIPILSSVAKKKTSFVTLSADSLEMQSTRFAEGKFAFSVTRENLKRLLHTMNRKTEWCFKKDNYLTHDLSSYELVQASVMVEAYTGDRPPSTKSDTEYSRIKLNIGQPQVSGWNGE